VSLFFLTTYLFIFFVLSKIRKKAEEEEGNQHKKIGVQTFLLAFDRPVNVTDKEEGCAEANCSEH
jgi:hypothetical protein